MASLTKHPRSDNWSVKFRFGGKQFCKSLDTDKEKEAERLRAAVERTLADMERGRLVCPADADFWQFVLSDGKLTSQPTAPTKARHAGKPLRRLLRLAVRPEGSEHHPHRANPPPPAGTGGRRNEVGEVDHGRRRTTIHYERSEAVGPQTVRKEVATLRMLLYRAEKLVTEKPVADIREMFRGLAYQKGKEKGSFLTWGEIEAQIKRAAPGKKGLKELWDRLFLSVDQVEEFLDWATAKKSRHPVPFFVPLLTASAHSGARLSELIRSRLEDWDMDGGTVVLREKKRSRKGDTLRRVNLSPRLTAVIQAMPFEMDIRLAVAVQQQFHKLLRATAKYAHFSLTEDTSYDKLNKAFVPDIHTHSLVWGPELTKKRVRAAYVQAHEDVLGKAVCDEDLEGVTVYFRKCRAPYKAALYVSKHGHEYQHLARSFRSIDLAKWERNPVRIDYPRHGKGIPFFGRPLKELDAEIKRERDEWRKGQAEDRVPWSPPPQDRVSEEVIDLMPPDRVREPTVNSSEGLHLHNAIEIEQDQRATIHGGPSRIDEDSAQARRPDFGGQRRFWRQVARLYLAV